MRETPNRARIATAHGGRASALALFLSLAACAGPARVDVASPTGDRARDRQAVADAFELAEPGGTIRFAAGTYVIGGEWLVLRSPGVALRGHPDGTTLVGCTEGEIEAMEFMQYLGGCVGFALAAEGQEISGLRFESFGAALTIREPTAEESEARQPAYSGGQVVEDNVFDEVNSFSIQMDADSVVWIRRNVYRNTWHALAMGGRNIRFVDNDASVPDPSRIYHGFPGGAVGLRPDDNGVCESIVIEGNRIEGHTEGVMMAVFPQDPPGSSCSNVTVRDNDIIMRPVYFPADDPRARTAQEREGAAERAGKPALAPAIKIANLQPLVGEGTLDWPEFWKPEGGWPAELGDARIHDITVEGNRITGSVGIAIEVVDVTDSRIIGNEIDVRPALTPDELAGLTYGGNGGPGVWVQLDLVEAVNGTAVWVSERSERITVGPAG